MKTFLLADDHKIVRTGIKHLLRAEFSSCQVFEANDEKSALEILKRNKIDFIILDLNMPDSDPISIINFAKTIQANIKILILSMNDEETYALRFLRLGVNGFLNKEAEESEIIDAVNIIYQGRTYFSDEVKIILTKSLHGKVVDNPIEKLSSREFQITKLLVEGKSNSEIAEILSISSSTVSSFKSRIFEKFEIEGSNIAALISIARKHNLI